MPALFSGWAGLTGAVGVRAAPLLGLLAHSTADDEEVGREEPLNMRHVPLDALRHFLNDMPLFHRTEAAARFRVVAVQLEMSELGVRDKLAESRAMRSRYLCRR